MPWSSEDLAKKFGQSAADIKQNLDSLGNSAEGADKAFDKMTKRQQDAIHIADQFDKAMSSSAKVLSTFGHSGVTAARGLRAVDAVSKSTASSLGAIGVGAVSAASGFKALSAEATAFTSDMSAVDRGIAGLVTGIGGLESKLKGISSSVGVNVVVGNLKALDDLEQRLKALPANINIGIGTGGGAPTRPNRITPAPSPVPPVPAPAPPKQKKSPVTPGTAPSSPNLSTPQAIKLSAKNGAGSGKAYMDAYLKNIKRASTKMKAQWKKMKDDDGEVEDKVQYVKVAIDISEDDVLQEFIAFMEPAARDSLELESSIVGVDEAVKRLKESNVELADAIKLARKESKEAAEEEVSNLASLERTMKKETKSIPDMFKKAFAEGGLEASKFGDGLGGNATGMMAAGVAGAYLATKMGDLAKRYADTAIGIAKFNTEMAASERTIIGMSSGALDQMRKQLYLTKDQATAFFDVVKKGVNELGMSQGKIMAVASALRDTFGGDQTERLKQYIDLLESMPTIENDLKITANVDDKAAAIFALAESGKMDVVMDLQGAGVLGGQKQKMPGADMINAQQKVAAISEGIQDFLVNKLFPDWGFKLSAIVDGASNVVSGLLATIGMIGALSTITGTAAAANLTSRAAATSAIVTAVTAQNAASRLPPLPGGAAAPAIPGVGVTGSSLATLGKGALKAAKGLGVITLATLGLELGFGYLEKKSKDAGNAVGAAEASIGKSAASIAGFAAAGFVIGSVFPGLGNVIGLVAGAALGLYLEFSNLKEATSTLVQEWFGKHDGPKGKTESENAEKNKGAQDRAIKSGIDLQRTLKQINNVAKNTKIALYKMQKEVSRIKVGNLQEIGGSAEGFGNTLADATTAARKQYQMQTTDFAKVRGDIMSNAKMDAAERRNALEVLNKEEMLATKDFVDAMNEVTEALFKTPAIIQAGLKSEIAGTMLDFADMGGMSQKDIDSAGGDQAKALEDNLKGVIAGTGAASIQTAKKIEALNNKRAAQEQGIFDLIDETDRKQAEGTKQVGELEARRRVVDLKHQLDLTKNPGPMEGKGNIIGAALIGGPILAQAEMARQEREQKEKIAKLEGQIADAQSDVNAETKKQVAEGEMSARLKRTIKVDEKTGKKSIDYKAVKGVMAETDDELGKVNTLFENATTKAKETFSSSIFDSMVGTAQAIKEYSEKAAAAAQGEQKADVGEKAPFTAEKKNAEESLGTANEQMAELQKGMSEKLRGLGLNLSDVDIKAIVDKISAVGMSAGDIKAELQKTPKLWEAIEKSMAENTKAVDQKKELGKQKSVLETTRDILKSNLDLEDGLTLILKDTASSAQEIRDATQKVIEAEAARWKKLTENVLISQRTASAAERALQAESLAGDGIEAQGAAAAANVDMIGRQADSYREAADKMEAELPILQDQLKAAKENREALEAIYNQTPEGDVPKKAKAKSDLDKGVVVEDSFEARISSKNREIDNARKAAMEAEAALGQAGDGITHAFEALEKSASSVRLRNFDEYSQVLVDTADYAGTVADAATKSFQIAKDVAAQRYEEDKKALEAGLTADRVANKERLKTYMGSEATNGITDPEQLKALEAQKAAELEKTTQSKYQLEAAKVELKQKKSVVDAAKRSKELKEREIDVQQGLLDDAMSFASEFGGSFSAVMELQQINVGLARQQLDAAKEYRDELVAAGTEGLALQEAQADVIKKQLDVRRKELGVQKDMMERLLGSVFGELNASFGARRGFMSDQALLGMNATRMKSASGMFVDVPGGDPGTIEGRAAKRMTSGDGLGGVFGQSGSPEVAGVMGDVLKALKSTPKRTPLEAAAAKAAAATADNTGKTADNTGAGTVPGSLYTHDITAEKQAEKSEGYLAGILSVLKELTIGVLTGDGFGGGEGAGEKVSKDAKAVKDKVEAAAASGEKAAKANGEKISEEVKGLAASSGKTSDSTEKSEKNLTKSLLMEKRTFRDHLKTMRDEKKSVKEREEATEAAKKSADKISSIESAIRVRENMNPNAGAAPGIADYDRVMAGKPMEEFAQLNEDQADEEVKKAKSKGVVGKSGAGKVDQSKLDFMRKYSAKTELDKADEEVRAAELGLSQAQFATKAMKPIADQAEEEMRLQRKIESKKEILDTARTPEDKEKAQKEYELAQDRLTAAQERNANALFDLPKKEEAAKKKLGDVKDQRAEKSRAYQMALASGGVTGVGGSEGFDIGSGKAGKAGKTGAVDESKLNLPGLKKLSAKFEMDMANREVEVAEERLYTAKDKEAARKKIEEAEAKREEKARAYYEAGGRPVGKEDSSIKQPVAGVTGTGGMVRPLSVKDNTGWSARLSGGPGQSKLGGPGGAGGAHFTKDTGGFGRPALGGGGSNAARFTKDTGGFGRPALGGGGSNAARFTKDTGGFGRPALSGGSGATGFGGGASFSKGSVAAKPQASVSGGVTAVGGTSQPRSPGAIASKPVSTAGAETMASKAAGTAVVPPTVGAQVAQTPGGAGAGSASSSDISCSMTGELAVTFNTQMFESAVATVVGKIMFNAENTKKFQNKMYAS